MANRVIDLDEEVRTLVATILLWRARMDEMNWLPNRLPKSLLVEQLPESIVSAQWVWGARSLASRSPEGRLMLAVLEDAVATLARNACGATRAERRALEEVEGWCAAEDRSWPFSFLNICETLGLDPQNFRDGLVTWKAQLKAASPWSKPRLRIRRPMGDRTRVVERGRRRTAAAA